MGISKPSLVVYDVKSLFYAASYIWNKNKLYI